MSGFRALIGGVAGLLYMLGCGVATVDSPHAFTPWHPWWLLTVGFILVAAVGAIRFAGGPCDRCVKLDSEVEKLAAALKETRS